MILSGGDRELTVPGKNLKVAASMTLDRKDLSGQSSNTAMANGGNKPQELSVSLQLPVDRKQELGQLLELALALDATGNPVVYRIDDDLAVALHIRQVIFAGTFSAAENDTLRVFDVAFKLQEYVSVAEKLENNAAPQVQEKTPDGEVVITGADPAQINVAIESQL